MLSADTEKSPSPPALDSLWFPGKKTRASIGPISDRAQEIAKSREDLLGLLRDLPESEYELSLTDLVENGSLASDDNSSSDQKEPNQLGFMKERNQPNRLRRRGSSSGGVLLNMYMPTSLTRNLTGSRSGRRTISDGGRREREVQPMVSCWSAILNKVRRRSRRA